MEDPPPNNNINNNNINTTSSSSPAAIDSSNNVSNSGSSSNSREKSSNTSSSEQVRSRWTPKPEQILILESIFNSGMVNPPKEETVRIRKLLEKFGAVGDANVFYWFQNRRSRSRRRQLQASLAASVANPLPPAPMLLGAGGGGLGFFDYGNQLSCSSNISSINNNSNNNSNNTCRSSSSGVVTTTSFAPSIYCSSGGVDDVFATFSSQMGAINNQLQLDNTSCCSSSTTILCPSNESNLDFQLGVITVFINGVATQVGEGPVDMKAMFGEEVMLVHSSGVPVPFNDFGFSFHSLQHGESYFLVPRFAT